MQFQTVLSSKGQVVIPKKVRDVLGLQISQSIVFDLNEDKKEVVIKNKPDIIDLVNSKKLPLKIKKTVPVLKTRELFEKNYERF